MYVAAGKATQEEDGASVRSAYGAVRPLPTNADAGRKNFLFVGNDESGENLAGLYSLIATCEANEVKPSRLPRRCPAPRANTSCVADRRAPAAQLDATRTPAVGLTAGGDLEHDGKKREPAEPRTERDLRQHVHSLPVTTP